MFAAAESQENAQNIAPPTADTDADTSHRLSVQPKT
jgi:hypothetical protein